ncbi:MAG TPA: hypothetical protein PLI41_07620 [Bacteroidales bacterium]|nr:hypothetical protein [Bacteroidales bacterium]
MFSLRKISVLLLLYSVPLALSGEDPMWYSAGAAGTGMGSVSATGSGFWSSFSNQALLTENNSYSAGISFLSRFNIPELGTYSAGLILPAGKSTGGIMYYRFGYSEYKREKIGLACGMRMSKKISAGVQIDYVAVRTSNKYIGAQSLTFETGLLIHASENVSVGIHLFNPVPNSLRKSFVPSSLSAGVETELSRSLNAAAELSMSSERPLTIRLGFDYEAINKLHLRGGFSTENTSFTFGTGFTWNSVIIDLAFATHERLGITSAASLIFIINENRNFATGNNRNKFIAKS